QEGGAGEAGTTHDAGSDARPDSSSSAEASPEGSPSAASSDDSDGCGCRIGSRPSGSWLWLGLLGLGWLRRRRAHR
ncbi:MAG TPA: MYXO-CTERM sorting domain-containing protein, partial [Polyangiaceae bacterium]|nr:MYXO-CTERM sorting domain-containing protein [Polyangiaceae bacterium]